MNHSMYFMNILLLILQNFNSTSLMISGRVGLTHPTAFALCHGHASRRCPTGTDPRGDRNTFLGRRGHDQCKEYTKGEFHGKRLFGFRLLICVLHLHRRFDVYLLLSHRRQFVSFSPFGDKRFERFPNCLLRHR